MITLMILIVGLGNPGSEYAKTPHNMGFRVIDYFHDVYISDAPWQKKLQSALARGEHARKPLILQKPLTFMNNSGSAVAGAMKMFGIKSSESLWVIHDELDLPWGRVKVELGRSAAGHKGVDSIIETLGTKQFWRFRVGIRPDTLLPSHADIDTYLTECDIPSRYAPLDPLLQEKVSVLLAESLEGGIQKRDERLTG